MGTEEDGRSTGRGGPESGATSEGERWDEEVHLGQLQGCWEGKRHQKRTFNEGAAQNKRIIAEDAVNAKIMKTDILW